MLPYINVKNAYKKFHLKDMQMISEDALKSLHFTDFYNTFQISVQCCKATIHEAKCRLVGFYDLLSLHSTAFTEGDHDIKLLVR